MGMFDNITCHYPLPDGFNDQERIDDFQTKDLDCDLSRYVITKDGQLIHAGEQDMTGFTGTIEFYTGNWCGSGAGYTMTDDDQPPWNRSYTATFFKGTLKEITGGLEPVNPAFKHVLRADFDKVVAPIMDEHYRKAICEKHENAMRLAEEAELEKDHTKKKRLFLEAADNERQAANWTHKEPSSTVLHRSAASLSFSAGDNRGTLDCISNWMQMQRCCGEPPPPEIVEEIADLLRAVADRLASH